GIEEVLSSFIGQFYADKPPPRTVLVSHELPEAALIAEALSVSAGRRVDLAVPRRGDKQKLLEGVAAAFGLDAAPERIEVYDNSHIQGTNPVGAMIVAGPEGFRKSA